MPEDLPIYSDSMLRTRLQFADLEKLKGVDATAVWEKADRMIEALEGGVNAQLARQTVQEQTKTGLIEIHSILFKDRNLRQAPLKPLFRGQDCPDPEFIDRSLDNFVNWLSAESVAEIHPIERA